MIPNLDRKWYRRKIWNGMDFGFLEFFFFFCYCCFVLILFVIYLLPSAQRKLYQIKDTKQEITNLLKVCLVHLRNDSSSSWGMTVSGKSGNCVANFPIFDCPLCWSTKQLLFCSSSDCALWNNVFWMTIGCCFADGIDGTELPLLLLSIYWTKGN